MTKEAHMSSFPTVLIVDDSRLSRMMIRAFITQAHPDWTIVEASNGLEALEKTATQTVDLMTIDLNMPGMDGLTLATQLQHNHPTAHIALVTANIQESVRQRAAAAGMGFIAKPVSENSVLACLSALENRRA
jgi:two-component system, chemotaxis family, chemotaxis protein CheY